MASSGSGNGNSNSFSLNELFDTTTVHLEVSDIQCQNVENSNTVTINVNPRPIYYSIDGPFGLSTCANQTNVIYTLDSTPSNYRYNWSTSFGLGDFCWNI